MIVGRALNGLALVAPRMAGQAAFAMFTRTGARAAVRADEAAVQAGAARGRLTVDGKEVVTYRWGDGGRPVLLVHGWQSRASRFAAFVPRLRELGFTPVAFDAPGNGDSGGRTTNAFEYAGAIERIQQRCGPFEAIVAHSFGAIAAFRALRSGVSAGRLVTVSGVADFGMLAGAFAGQAGLDRRAMAALAARTARLTGPDPWRRLSATYRPEQIGVPILAVHDDDDRRVDPGQADLIAAAYGDRARVVRTTGLGHHRILVDPGVVTTTLDFLSAPRPA